MIWYVMQSKIVDSTHFPSLKRGWGNGYVAIPPTHPAYKTSYHPIMFSFNIHGGLTYASFGNGKDVPEDWWVFGFDTAHIYDTIERWPKEAVEAETKRLFCQLLDIELGGL